MAVHDTVMKSLRAVGSSKEALFYAKLFQNQQAERFALITIDPRCLYNPLLEALTSDLKILADLELTPVLLVGDVETDAPQVNYQSQKLCKALDAANIANSRLNCASYEVMASVRKLAKAGRFVVLEMMRPLGRAPKTNIGLEQVLTQLKPAKMIFLRPSGGFRKNGNRVPVVNIDQLEHDIDPNTLESTHIQFLEQVRTLAAVVDGYCRTDTASIKGSDLDMGCTFVLASPLNLLPELFTVQGAGTMLRRGARLEAYKSYKGVDLDKLSTSMENAFSNPVKPEFFTRPVSFLCVEENYRGGAIVNKVAGQAYLSKFWVTREAQGEGIASDIWKQLMAKYPSLFWRSKRDNPFNAWYLKSCDGMQIDGPWRVFWTGLEITQIETAIQAAIAAPVDFIT